METTKKIETEILAVMDDYWGSYLKGDLQTWASYLPDNYRNIGTTKEEIWNNKAEIIDYTKRVFVQAVGMAEVRNKKTQIIPYAPYTMVHELGNLYVKVEEGWVYYAPFRLSSLLEKTTDGWKILHQHGSFPDSKADEGEAFGFDELKAENKKLRDAIEARTIDLERKNRELEIEAGLERVRARTMAMHSSHELLETGTVLFKELSKLGVNIFNCGYVLIDDEAKMGWNYGVNPGDGSIRPLPTGIPQTGTKVLETITESWKKQEPILLIELDPQETIEHQTYMADNMLNFSLTKAALLARSPERLAIQTFNFKHGYLLMVGDAKLTTDQEGMVMRFVRVFEQTYIRFLDLKKAEAQAREAQIELAMERVRARSMAMHTSEELSDVVALLFDEIKPFGFASSGIELILPDEHNDILQFWTASTGQDKFAECFNITRTIHPFFQKTWKAWKDQLPRLTLTLEGEEKKKFDRLILTEIDFKRLPEEIKQFILNSGYRDVFSSAIMKYGLLESVDTEPISEEQFVILERFAKVFEQTYTRFLDLQKAEAQAREAQIEAALERVRSKAMAMRSSEDIGEATTILFNEIEKLGLETMRCGILIIHEDKIMDVWTTSTTSNDKIASISGQINMAIHPLLEGIFNGWKSGASQSQYELVGKDAEKYYMAIGQELSYKLPTSSAIKDRHFNTSFNFEEGALFTFTKSKISESVGKIYKRFAKVFGLTYQRYRELIESEKREKEANKQSSLDRVRGEIASMRSKEDLNRITPIIWQELINLGVPFFRCGVFIMNEENENIQVYLSDPTGKSLGLMNLDFMTSDLTKNSANAWRNKEVFKTHWNKEEFSNWTNSLKDLGKIKTKEGYQGGEEAPDSLDLHFVPFKQGMLYVGNLESLTEDQIELVRNLSESFSIAYSRYEDFSKLEKAKANLEQTLDDLKSTQSQLIQSEKMASLGELTAGIAHEIQNPLNFVNNFSEVSSELMDEMNEEIENGDLEEAKFIAIDIKQNLEKINLHGQRASAIVKGMLDHSRTSSGEKMLTDINQLTDEYLRLAYHGLRAKDRSFNAKYETIFDEKLPQISVVPQDVGRVILNLINNAFYAVSEKLKVESKKSSSDYEPSVSVTTGVSPNTPTSQYPNSLMITIKDNGLGIPDDIKDKIFQPFFTTKPTGQGTGLGLSLSYDIVKAHGGELSVESEHGEGTEFNFTIPIA